MLKDGKLAALALLGALVAGNAYAADKAAAVVNGHDIPESRIDTRVQDAVSRGQTDSPELRKMIRDNLINLELLSQAAAKKGLDKQTAIADEVELSRQTVLARAYIMDYVKEHPITEDALKHEYETLVTMRGKHEYKAAHILVTTEAEAKAIAAQLKKGAKFEKIAKAKSKDPGSASRGGDLGWNVPSTFVPQFSDAMTHLKKGQVSAPVHTQFGWHIIKLEDVRDVKAPPLEQVKPQLTQRLQQELVQKAIADLRAAAKIE